MAILQEKASGLQSVKAGNAEREAAPRDSLLLRRFRYSANHYKA